MEIYKKTHENQKVANTHISKIEAKGGIVKQSIKNGKIIIEYSFPNKKNDYIEKTYGKLKEKTGVITSKSDWFDKDGIKRLQYGFDYYRQEDENTLFYYSWDFDDSGLPYSTFVEDLKNYFENKYNKKVSTVKGLYIGWKRKEKGTY